ncbi:hypothetical protein HKBW3C_02129, partial [Candidatus Hakubella thermalkaliphila]
VLEPGKQYRWNLQAYNRAGWSELSSILYFQTPPQDIITARIDSWSVDPRQVQVGQSVVLSMNFTNTGTTTHTFIAGASLWRPDGSSVDFEREVTLSRGASTSVSWTRPIDQAGSWDVQFAVWRQKPFTSANLLTKAPSSKAVGYIRATSVVQRPSPPVPSSPGSYQESTSRRVTDSAMPLSSESFIGPRETKLEKGEPEDYGAVIIPKELFPEGNGVPIPIYIPPVINDSNASFGDWANVEEIADENVKFSTEKLLKNLAKLTPSEVPEYPGYKVGAGAAFSMGGAVLLAFGQAFEKDGFKITIQRNSQGNFRAVIQIFTDKGNVIRRNAGGATRSPDTGIAAVAFSRHLKDKFSLPDGSMYQAFWEIDKNHRQDPYVAYMGLRPDKNAVLLIPKIYSGDIFRIVKRTAFLIWGPTVLELRGKEYVGVWSYLLPAQEAETLRVLELLPVSFD